MGLVFKPQQQDVLEIGENRQAVFGNTGLVTWAFPTPDLAVPSELACRGVSPPDAGSRAGPGKQKKRQHEAPIKLPGALKKPQHSQQRTAKPQAQQKRAQETRTPQRIDNRRGVVRGQGLAERG